MRVQRYLLLTTTALFPLAVLAAEQDRHGAVEEVLVTSRPYEQDLDRALQAGSVLSGEELARRVEGTLGETLSGLPGVSSSYFGPAASRPVIRGLSGDRVRILNGGIGSFDAAAISPDHAVALDPLTAERIEIVRGPGTLLYGGAAVGGVINVFDGRIPSRLPDNGAEGAVRAVYGSAADERSADGAATLSAGQLAVHIDGSYRKTDDLKIPGFADSKRLRALEAEAAEEHEQTKGRLFNSAAKTMNGAVGMSYVWEAGFFGASYSRNDQLYGVPGHAHGPDGDHADDAGAVRIDLVQDRFDVMGEMITPFLMFEKAKLRFGYADYRHTELEGDEIGTVFNNKGWEGRLELVQRSRGAWRGAMGAQLSKRDFAAVGEEAFTPPSVTKNWGLFTVQEVVLEPLTLEAGARFERVTVDVDALGQDRAFSLLSISAGASVELGDDWSLGATLSRSKRAPAAEELFSDGPHLATRAYELGNPALSKETALSMEGILRKRAGAVQGALSLFYTKFDDFIYESHDGLQADDLPVFAFMQRDARFYGGELELTVDIHKSEAVVFSLDVAADIVRASLSHNGGPLPRIPPKSLTVGIAAQGAWYDARIEVEVADKQSRIAAYELPTDGYTLLNMNVNVHPFARDDVTLSLRARNLTNAEARTHTSFLKDYAPLPGRDVRLSATYRF